MYWKKLHLENGIKFITSIKKEHSNLFRFFPCPSEGSLHSSDSVSDSSPPPAVVQTGVPTQVVQQVQTAQQVKFACAHKCDMNAIFLDCWHSTVCLSQQRSVVQATSQIAKTEPGTQLNVTSLQPVHISPEVSQHICTNIYNWQLNMLSNNQLNFDRPLLISEKQTHTVQFFIPKRGLNQTSKTSLQILSISQCQLTSLVEPVIFWIPAPP